MSLEEVIRYEPTLLDSLLTFRTLTHQIPPRRSLKSPKSAVLKSRVIIILFVMLPPRETLNSTISWSLQAKDVPSQSFVYIGPAIQSSLLVSSSSVSKYYHQRSSGSSWTVLCFQQISVPHESQACDSESSFSYLPKASLPSSPCSGGP